MLESKFDSNHVIAWISDQILRKQSSKICLEKGIKQYFALPGEHWLNSKAERFIKTITDSQEQCSYIQTCQRGHFLEHSAIQLLSKTKLPAQESQIINHLKSFESQLLVKPKESSFGKHVRQTSPVKSLGERWAHQVRAHFRNFKDGTKYSSESFCKCDSSESAKRRSWRISTDSSLFIKRGQLSNKTCWYIDTTRIPFRYVSRRK